MNLKPFNLEAALAGEKVVTRDGRGVCRVIYLPELVDTYFLVKAVISGQMYDFTLDGFYYRPVATSDHDLFMAPKTREGWISIYPDGDVYLDNDKATADSRTTPERIACVRIEWEE